MTYANAVSSYPSTRNQEYMVAIPKMNKITTSTSQKSQYEVDESSIDPDGFIRVKANEVKRANFRDRNRRKCDVKPNSIFSETMKCNPNLYFHFQKSTQRNNFIQELRSHGHQFSASKG